MSFPTLINHAGWFWCGLPANHLMKGAGFRLAIMKYTKTKGYDLYSKDIERQMFSTSIVSIATYLFYTVEKIAHIMEPKMKL
jgi:hypothetical protein